MNRSPVPGTTFKFGNRSSSDCFWRVVVVWDCDAWPFGRSESGHDWNSTDVRMTPHSGAVRDITSSVISLVSRCHLVVCSKLYGAKNLNQQTLNRFVSWLNYIEEELRSLNKLTDPNPVYFAVPVLHLVQRTLSDVPLAPPSLHPIHGLLFPVA